MITLKPVRVNSERIGIMGYRVAVDNFGTVKLEDVANMMSVNNTVHVADVVAVMSAYLAIVQQDLVRGYSVNFCDMLTFTPKVTSKGTATKEAWQRKPFDTKLIKRVRIIAATGPLKKRFYKGAPNVNFRMA